MPRKPIDYSNTHFYKVVCKDLNIKDCYVGHTTGYDYNIYQFIRQNGGFDNFDMVLIETRECINSLHAHQIERQYIEEVKPTLNKLKPNRTPEEKQQYHAEYAVKNKERLKQQAVQYRIDNIETIKAKDKEKYETNKERISQRAKLYRERNRDKINEQQRQYRQENKEVIQERNRIMRETNSEKIECVCGGKYSKLHKAEHFKTKKHLCFMERVQEDD